MRALAGWVLALSLAASPALAAGSGDANSNSPAGTAKDNSGSASSAAAKTDASSLETEISDLRDLIDSQANQLDSQNSQLQQEQKKLEMLEQQLKASSAAQNSGSTAPASAVNVSASAPASSPVATASVAVPTVPAASSSASSTPSAAVAEPQQGNGGEPPSPLFFRIGSATFTPLGFMDLTNVFRSPAIGSGIGTNFASVPYRIPTNFPNAGLTEDRFSAQNSRLGFRVDADVAGGHAIGYLETDFLGNAAATISITSNSYTLRMRVYFVDYTKGKFEVLGGQDWSMLTPNRKGIDPIPGNIFYSQNMDTNYQVGLVWERTPQIRFVYHASKAAAFGISLENAEQYIGGGNGSANAPVVPSPLSGTTAFVVTQFDNGSNSNGTNIPNLFPDLVVKAAFDPMVSGRDFHFEVSGLLKEFKANTFMAATATPLSGGTSLNSTAEGGAVSANTNLELFKNFHLIANSYWSDGGGQKIFGFAPDVVINPQVNATSPFTISPLHSGAGIGGVEWQVIPKMMIYGYYGGVYISKDVIVDSSSVCSNGFCGYGVPATTSGSNLSTTEGQNRVVQEGTVGLIPIFWRSPNYGALQLITQYSYLSRAPWSVAPNTPKIAHAGMAWVDLRYVLP